MKNDEGVLLFYPESTVARQFHRDETPKVGDRDRVLIVRAEHGLDLLVTVIECLQLEDVAEIDRAVDAIRSGLDVRARLGLAPRSSQT